MADTKISNLSAVATVNDTDELATNQSFTSKKVTVGQLKSDVPRVVATFSASNQTASIGNTVLYSSPPSGIYRMSTAVMWEQTGNGCGVTVDDGEISMAWTRFSLDQGAPTVTFSSTNPFSPGTDGWSTLYHRTSGGENFTFSVVYGVGDSTDAYTITIILEKIG